MVFSIAQVFHTLRYAHALNNLLDRTDRIRQEYLESMGLSIVQFYEWDVKKDIRAVVQGIESWIEKYEKRENDLCTSF